MRMDKNRYRGAVSGIRWTDEPRGDRLYSGIVRFLYFFNLFFKMLHHFIFFWPHPVAHGILVP